MSREGGQHRDAVESIVWDTVAISIVAASLLVAVTFIWKSRRNGHSPDHKQMLRYSLLVELVIQLTAIILIGCGALEKGSMWYGGVSSATSILLLYPSIISTASLCDQLKRIQTLSNVPVFKFLTFIFFIFDVVVRTYLIIECSLSTPPDKWTWGAILLWATAFVAFLVPLFMIRAESRRSFNYIQEVLAPKKRKLIHGLIWQMDMFCVALPIYGVLASFQFSIDALGVLHVIGVYGQWIVANTLLIGCLSFYLKPETQIDHGFHLRDMKGPSAFRLLDAVDGR